MRYLGVLGNRRRTGGEPGGILPVGIGITNEQNVDCWRLRAVPDGLRILRACGLGRMSPSEIYDQEFQRSEVTWVTKKTMMLARLR